MLSRIIRGLIVGLFAAAGAMALDADQLTIIVVIAIPVVVAMVDVLSGLIFTAFVLFGLGALIWAYTPVGKMILNIPTVQKYMLHDKKD